MLQSGRGAAVPVHGGHLSVVGRHAGHGGEEERDDRVDVGGGARTGPALGGGLGRGFFGGLGVVGGGFGGGGIAFGGVGVSEEVIVGCAGEGR